MVFFHWFYVQELWDVFFEMVLIFSVWTVFTIMLKGKAKRIIGAVFAFLAVAVILSLTILRRSSDLWHQYNFIPFYTFVEAKIQPELYRTMLMNVYLFVPLGMSFPFALRKDMRFKLLFTVLFAFALSCTVEALQLILTRGMCDVDDVIANTLGAFLGYWSFFISDRISRFIKKHKEKSLE